MSVLKRKVTRRQFIKLSALGLVAVGAGLTAMDFIGSSYLPKGRAPDKLWKWSKEAHDYTKLGNSVQCQLCPNKCILGNNQRGVCGVRVNKKGKLYTLVYGNPCAVHVDPVEKKPLFHFLPGTKSFSIATAGCNFSCLNCQNWQISQRRPEQTENTSLFPEDAVKLALQYNATSIAYTYSEPTIFYEYMYDTSKIAHSQGLKNQWITNGYMNPAPLKRFCKYLDAANVDLKSFDENIYATLNSGHLEPVLNTLKLLKRRRVWFEITNLVIPTYTDNLDMIGQMCEWVAQNLGPDYPLHFSRFGPMYKLMTLPPTPVKKVEQARNIAIKKGLHYVYVGNVPGHSAENTYCPNCSKVVIERDGYKLKSVNLQNNSCRFCGEKIAGIWS